MTVRPGAWGGLFAEAGTTRVRFMSGRVGSTPVLRALTTGRGPARTSAVGFTLIELLIVVAIIGIVAAIAVPGLLRARMAANESTAIGTMRALHSGEMAYITDCGRGGYATSFLVLGTPPPGSTQAYLSVGMTLFPVPTKAGYQFLLSPGAGATPGPTDCNGTATSSTYYCAAEPLTFAQTGNRSFATTPAGAIWQQFTGVAPPEPLGAPATPIQ